MNTNITNLRALGESHTWTVYDTEIHFRFEKPEPVRDVAGRYGSEYEIEWTKKQLAFFDRFLKIGELDNLASSDQLLCLCEGKVVSLNFEEQIGSEYFQCYFNSSIDNFVESFVVFEKCFGDSVQPPPVGTLLETLVEVTRLDGGVNRRTAWWILIESLLAIDPNILP